MQPQRKEPQAHTLQPQAGHDQTATIFMTVKGAEKLADFMKQAFGATEDFGFRMKGMLWHAQMRIGNSTIMIGDAMDRPGITSGVYLYFEDADAAYRQALDAGAKSLMEPADMFYGDRIANVQDPFGNNWTLATHIEDVAPDVLEERAAAMMAGKK